MSDDGILHLRFLHIFYSLWKLNKTNMCRIKSDIYSTKVGWTWATWAKSRIGPIWFPFVTHIGLPLCVPHETVLQIPSQSHMGCPYRAHIKSHIGPLWVLYFADAPHGFRKRRSCESPVRKFIGSGPITVSDRNGPKFFLLLAEYLAHLSRRLRGSL